MKKYPSLRIFKNPILESLTHVHPVVPLLIWVPFTLFLLARNVPSLTGLEVFGLFVSALIFWTFFEYILHRYMFHFPAKGKFGKQFVFLFHGLHHDDPKDPLLFLEWFN